MCVQFMEGGGGSVQHIGGYHEYTGGCSVHWRVTMMQVGDIMIHVGGYYEYIGDVQYIEVFNISQRLLSIFSPT